MEKIYALYKGDEFIDMGTVQELAERRGVKSSSMSYFLTDAYKRRQRKRGDPWNTLALVPTQDT